MKSVLASEETEVGENEWIQPSNDERGDSDDDAPQMLEIRRRLSRQPSFDLSIKTGATHIMNPKDKKHMETCLIENEDSEPLQTILANELSDVDEQNWIQPGSTAEDGDDTNEMQPTSLLDDFKETIHEFTETLHNLHLPHSNHPKSEIKDKHGLLETAMETMLMERSSILGAQPTASPIETSEPKKFEDKRNASIDSFKKLLVAPFSRRRSNDSLDLKHTKKPEMKKEKFGLFDSAMKTMLVETAHIIEGVGIHPTNSDENESKIEMRRIEPSLSLENEEKSIDNDKSESENASTTQSNLNDKPTTSHDLTNVEPTISIGGNKSNEIPVFLLTKDPSNSNLLKDKAIDELVHTHIESKNLLPIQSHDRVSVDNIKRSPKPTRKSNLIASLNIHNNNNHSKTLIHCKSASLINLTNKTKLLASDTHSKHRSADERANALDSANNHVRAESFGAKTNVSPTKVTTSSSSYNTTTTSVNKTSATSKDKDGKDIKETICRRSSDSDLSVTPKGNENCINLSISIDPNIELNFFFLFLVRLSFAFIFPSNFLVLHSF